MKLLDGTEINKRQFNKWIKALRSGRYKQGKNRLESADGYCCLGVACKVLIPKKKQAIGVHGRLSGLFPDVDLNAPNWLTMINEDFCTHAGLKLSQMNDSYGHSFDEIADCLEMVYVHGVLDGNN